MLMLSTCPASYVDEIEFCRHVSLPTKGKRRSALRQITPLSNLLAYWLGSA